MKYNININQYELSELDVSLQEAVVIDWLNGMFSSDSERIENKRVGGWTWISPAHLIEDMPILRIKTVSGGSKLLKRIKELEFIELKSEGRGKFLYAKPTSKMNDLYFSKSHRKRKSVLTETDSVPEETINIPQDITNVLEDINQYTISDTLDTNTIINNDKKTLPIERGNTPHQRVDSIYRDLFKDKYGVYPPISDVGSRLKTLKDLLKQFTEVQLAFLLIVFFAWKGMNDNNDKEQNYLQSKAHNIFTFRFNLAQYEVYTRNVANYSKEFDDSDLLLPIVGRYITELKSK